MDVTREDVLRCAKLTQLSLTEDEIEPMRQAMAKLLTQAGRLDELDLDGLDADHLEPTADVRELDLPLREDKAEPGLTQAEALANAPRQERGHFAVPRVL